MSDDIDIPAPAQVTVTNHCWPQGWAAIQYGWEFGFGFTAGVALMAYLLIGLTKLFVLVFA